MSFEWKSPRTICFAFAWSFLGPKIHWLWVLKINETLPFHLHCWLEPEDQRDTTVPSTLLRPAAITSPICPLCPCAQIFWGRMGIAKVIKVSLHHWEDWRLHLQQGLRFPVSKLLRVSTTVFTFYKTLGFRFTMEVFSTRGGLGPSGAPMFLRNIVVTQVTPSTTTTLCQEIVATLHRSRNVITRLARSSTLNKGNFYRPMFRV